MKQPINNFFTLVLLLILISFQAFSQDIPERPDPPRLVNDFAGLLSKQEANGLERKLIAFSDSTSTQIAIVIVPDLGGYDRADYAQRLGEKWGIGQKGFDNGLLILVKPKTGTSRGEVFIAQGYGLEGAIPDIVAAEIVDYEILPAFREGKYYEGLNRATGIIMSLARGEFTADQYQRTREETQDPDIGGIIFIIILIIIFISIFSRRSGGPNSKNISSSGLPLWLLLGMMGSGHRSHRGSWGGFSGGGGGGGGFGGFGGGGFGGGGAGGSW